MASSNGFGRGPAAFIPSARLNNQGRATPESDAFASSDEDVDLTHSVHSVPSTKPAPPVNQTARRKSFLSEVQSGGVRKLSLPGLAAVGNGSQPGTPSGEHNLWGSPIPLGRVSSNGSTSMWANAGVWNEPRQGTTGRTGGPAGPSTVAFSPFASTSGNAGEETSPINAREITESTAVPFTIPLHPTAKTQRSHSYSVGQITSEKDALAVPGLLPTQPQTRTRQTGVANLRHQPTRPSTLREESEPVEPELFRDRDDDEENFGGVRLNSPALQFTQTVTDALLRQAVAANQNSTTRGVTASSTHNTTNTGNDKMQILNFTHVGTDTAVDDEVTEQTDSGRIERRFSEFAEPPRAHLQTSNLTVKSQWQTALGFGPLEDIPQSRRHSFAEMPTRRGSFAASTGGNTQAYGSVAAAYANVTESPETAKSNKQNPTRHTPFEMQASMEQSDLHNRAYAANYFSGVAPAARSRYEAGVPQSASSYSTTGPFHPGTSAGGFSRPGQDSPLYMVSFKCARADAYYVQDGTGLDVKVGDLVVVEADRGHDLGTVTHAKVNWARARELKEQAADEHYRWLMMFSQYNKTITSTTVNPNGMLAASNHPGAERAPIQGMGLGMHDASHIQEMKPKMIKRLAQPHEIATLRDKEGNEAKAKRVCQQKAAEHKLTMEILDAEFQMDWKKLTFYYFAETYVNFNVLVTDLFKMYKTRIWMSAINPASFASAPNQHPSGIGPGALQGRDSPMDARAFAQQFTPGNLSYQDMDPIGAVPPSRNPTSATFHELAIAQRQSQNGRSAFGALNAPQWTDPHTRYGSSGYGTGSTSSPEPFSSAPAMLPSFGGPLSVAPGNPAFARNPPRTPFNPAATPYGHPGAMPSGMYYNPMAAPQYYGMNLQHAQAYNSQGPFGFAAPSAMVPNQPSEYAAGFAQVMHNFTLSKNNESTQ